MFVGDIARAFAGLGSGVAHGVSSLGRRIRRLGEPDGPPAAPSIMPTFTRPRNPGEIVRRGPRVIEDVVGAAENDAREAFGSMRNTTPVLASDLPEASLAERRNLPIDRRDLPIPGLTPAPSMNTLRSALPSLSSRPSPPLAVPDMIPDIDLDRRNLPIPALPGHPGGPVSYNPVDAAKYDYTMAGAERDAEGDFTGRFRRDWKQTALATLAGAARGMATTGDVGGAIGGAVAGAGGSLISPQGGREFAFDTLYRPELEARQARERANQDRANMEIVNRAKLDDLRATTDERRANARKLGQPERRTVNRTIGINRRTGRREYFDASDPSQLALYDPEPLKNTTHAWGLGRNVQTGEIERYDAADPDQASLFEPYQFPSERQQPGGVLSQIGKIKKLKRNASQLWGAWGKETDPEKRRLAAEAAQVAQAAYNDEVAALGEAFPDLYETGGFTEANGNQGWAYYKPRQGGGQAPPQRSSQPTGRRKAVVGPDFVKHVADTLKVSPERAKQIVIDDGYEVR